MIDALLEYVRNEDRVCPTPMRWKELFEMLPPPGDDGEKLSLPLILHGWWDSSNLDKMLRVQHHIRWAAEHGVVAEVDAFLRGLPESDWHHVGD